MIHIRHMAGPLRAGGEAGEGRLWHAIETETGEQLGRKPALCGTQPGIMWAAEEGDAVTCERCLDKLGRIADDN